MNSYLLYIAALLLSVPISSYAGLQALINALVEVDVSRVEFEIPHTKLSKKTHRKLIHLADEVVKREMIRDVWYKKKGSLLSIALGSLITFLSGRVFFMSPWRSEDTLIGNMRALLAGSVYPSRYYRDERDYAAADANTFVLGASGGLLVAGGCLLLKGALNLYNCRRSYVHALAIKTLIEQGLVKNVSIHERDSDDSFIDVTLQ